MDKTKLEYNARAACVGLGYSEETIKSFVDWHLGEEARRDANDARMARANALTDAIIAVAVSPWIEHYEHKDFHEDNTPAISRGYDAEDERDAQTYQTQRNRGET